MNSEVIKHQPNLIAFWILFVKYFQKLYVVLTVMGFSDQRNGLPGLQVDPGKER